MDAVESYQQHFSAQISTFTGHRRHARATLIYLVTHHKYPALANLTALKALIDDAFVIDGLAASEDQEARQRLSDASLWLKELMDAERLVDAPMHFPPSYLADTLSLQALVRHEDKRIANQARKYRWRAEQSFTMGRQYYQNISRLIYLFDDFNDRRRHSVQAGQMGGADVLALYRYALDDREI
ncbi:hypothetical protein ACOTTU_07795 [Roseobacter sp. EG26]|uniref:hypothetical protein n=1 Tax=Roseobacter sp. EG26 TaxID=3412477 RepID=UPI003CE49921